MRKHVLTLYVLVLLIGIASNVQAQERTISGKVTDASDGTALPGVSIIVKGTTTGTTTNADGNYSISTPANATLVFSFIGLETQEVPVGAESTLDVTMSSNVQELSEVVVTAIGIERDKKALGYAVTEVSGSLLQQRSEPDPIRALNAKVAGVNIVGGGGAPGQSTKINIRGNSSLTGNTQPLFVVDGVPFDNSTNSGGDASGSFATNTVFSNRAYDIDPNNIESMTVLKGAAAAALYGSRATNGVVVITTKSGSKNRKKGLEVTYNGSYAQEHVAALPDYQNVYMQGSNQNYNAGVIGNWGPPFAEYVDDINNTYYGGEPRYSKTYSFYRNGPNKGQPYPDGFAEYPLAVTNTIGGNANFCTLFPELCDEYNNGIPIQLQPYDIAGEFFRTGHVIENGISISSTGDKTSLNAGVSRTTNEGIVENMRSARTSLNFGGTGILANGLTLTGNVNYVNTEQQSPPTGAGFYTDYGGFANEGSIYGRIFYLPRNYNLHGYPFENPANGNNLFYRALDNPLWSVKYNSFNSKVNRVFGNMGLSYDVTPWLNLTLKGGVNTYTENRRTITRKGGTGIPLGRISTQDLTNTELDFNFLATFSKDITPDFSVRWLVGANANQRAYNSRQLNGTNIIQTGLNATYATAVQLVPIAGSTGVTGDYQRLRRLVGVFTDLQLGYKETYFLGFVARNDFASTLYPKTVNQPSYFYPGVNAAVVVTDALGITSNFFNYGKLRAAYTKVGREPDPYLTLNTYQLGNTYRDFAGREFFNATQTDQLKNPRLRPEFTTEFEVGAELQFFQNRIGIDVAYFDRSSKDQIVAQRVAASTGFTTQIVNVGELNNKGVELLLNLTPIKLANGFQWNSTAAFTRIRTQVIDAGPQGEIFLGGTGLSSLGTIHRTGEPYGMIFGTKNARDENGNLLINETTGMPIALPSSEIIGNPMPDFTLGWTNTFTWKGISLTALIDYRQGGDMFSSTAGSLLLRGQLAGSEDREALRIIPGVYGDPGTFEPIRDDAGNTIPNTTSISAFDYHFTDGFGAYGADEVNVYDITTIRLREVTLGYELPAKLLSKTLFGTARISLSGRNLWFYAPNMLKGLNFDPEVLSSFADSNIQGFDLGATPSTRRYGANLTLTF